MQPVCARAATAALLAWVAVAVCCRRGVRATSSAAPAATLSLGPLFANGCILQQGTGTTVWGAAAPHSVVTVTVTITGGPTAAAKTASASANVLSL